MLLSSSKSFSIGARAPAAAAQWASHVRVDGSEKSFEEWWMRFMRGFAENMKYAVLEDSKGDMPEEERLEQLEAIKERRRRRRFETQMS